MSQPKQERLNSKAIEFQPDALEIKNERLPWPARVGVFSAFFFLAGAVIWACVSQVDVIVGATGKLVTDTPPVVIKPLERTVIKSIDVKVGDVVKKDQVLMHFDPVNNLAEIARLESEVSTLTAQFNRLLAEFKNQPYQPGDTANEDVEWQLAIYKQRRKFYDEKIRYYDQSIAQIKASQHSTEESLEKQTERLEAVKKIEQIYTKLLDKKAISLKETLEIQITRMEMESEVDKLRNSLVEQKHQEQTAIASKNSYIEEWRNAISEELVKVQRELTSNQKSYEKAVQLNSYDRLRSPCDAVVHEIAAFSVGSAVREAEALITLVPLDSKIELEAEIEPKDIAKVHTDSSCRIKLNAFPFQKHGTLEGTIRNISEDTFQRQQGEAGATRTYYRARIDIDDKVKLRGVPENFRLIPGMEAQVEIRVGRRRVIEYVIHPLIKSLDEAIREP